MIQIRVKMEIYDAQNLSFEMEKNIRFVYIHCQFFRELPDSLKEAEAVRMRNINISKNMFELHLRQNLRGIDH